MIAPAISNTAQDRPFLRNGLSDSGFIPVLSQSASRELTIKPELAYGVTFIVGGTRLRWVLVGTPEEGYIQNKINWTDAKKLALERGVQAGNGRERDAVLDIAVDSFIQDLGRWQVSPEQIKYLGISVAGPVATGPDGIPLVTTPNTGVEFNEYALGTKLLQLIKEKTGGRCCSEITEQNVPMINDGHAGTLGEYLHPLGALRNHSDGVFVIIGTGVGGGGIRNKNIDSLISEFGHIILVDQRTKAFTCHSLAELRKEGSIDEKGEYLDAPHGKAYSENYLAGPWIACRLVKNLGDELNAITELLKNHFPHLSKTYPNLEREIGNLSALNPSDRHKWGSTTNGDIAGVINSWALGMSQDDVELKVAQLNPSDPLLHEKIRVFEAVKRARLEYFKTVGSFCKAIYKNYGRNPIVLGGGVMENIAKSKDREFALNMIRNYSRVKQKEMIVFSEVSPEDRESMFVAQGVARVRRGQK